MMTLGAMVVALAFLAGVVDPLPLSENLPVAQLPVDAANVLPVDAANALPVDAGNPPLPLPLYPPLAKPSGSRPQLPKKGPAGDAGGKCSIAATYMLSANKLQEFVNGSLPDKIQEMVKCSDVNLAGLVGSVLNTVCGTDLLALLPLDAVSSLTNILPLDVLDGVLGKSADAKAPSTAEGSDPAAVPVAPVVPDSLPVSVPGAETAQAVAEPISHVAQDVASKAKSLTGLADGLVKGVDLSKVSDVGNTAKNLLSSGLVSDLLPSLGSGSSSGGLDVSGLLLNAKVGDVTVNSITYSMTDNGMEAKASVTADVIAEGAAGAVVTLLGFQVSMVVTVHISSTHEPANNTCQLEVEQKSMEVTEVCITLVKTVLDTLPLPLPLPISLDDVVLMALSVELTENAKESSCAIQLDDFDTGKNVTGAVCQYTIAKTKISDDGLCISYCAKCTWNKIPVLMPGSVMPKHHKNDSVSLILSHKAVKEYVNRCVEPVRVKVQDVEARVIDLFYTYPSPTTVRVTFKFALQRAGQPYGTAKAVALYTHNCRSENGKMVAEVTMTSTPQLTTEPPEIMDEMPGLMSAVLPKAVSAITACMSTWNLPPGVSLYPVPSSKITTLKSNDLHVGK